MADIRPFRGVHYSESLIKDWSAVICPPYDIISPQQQEEFYQSSEYNFIRLESGRELPQDTSTDNKYTRSVTTLEQWLEQGVLECDRTPSIYLHNHYFRYQSIEYKRRSLVVRVRLEEWDKQVIRPHEGTLTEARGDRLSLLWALQANTSPILSLYEDRERKISPVLSSHEQHKPLISSRIPGREGHDAWAISDSESVRQVCNSLAEQPLYIADGHHRYESALNYRNEKGAMSPFASGEEPANFVMMELVDFHDPGLIILSPYRLVRGIAKPVLNELLEKLEVFFEIEELPLSLPDAGKQVSDLLAGNGKVRLILFGLTGERFLTLKLRDQASASQMMPHFHSELYKELDVSIIDHIILENLLGLSAEKEKTSLTYSYDIGAAVNRVLNQEYQLVLLFNPVKPDVIKTIADAGDKMPRKSTYFYPKSPSGLVFNRLV
ncbi:DUF1015 domain-containing protein [Chloroflexota bacterium]